MYQCYVGHRVSFSNQEYAHFVTERHLSVTRVNFIRVFLDNPGYFGDPGHGELGHMNAFKPVEHLTICVISKEIDFVLFIDTWSQ